MKITIEAIIKILLYLILAGALFLIVRALLKNFGMI
jgi:hypothetical protein